MGRETQKRSAVIPKAFLRLLRLFAANSASVFCGRYGPEARVFADDDSQLAGVTKEDLGTEPKMGRPTGSVPG
jgi:hypothetical protein